MSSNRTLDGHNHAGNARTARISLPLLTALAALLVGCAVESEVSETASEERTATVAQAFTTWPKDVAITGVQVVSDTIAVAIDAADTVHIAFAANDTTIKYARKTAAGAWSVPENISSFDPISGSPISVSIAVGADSLPHVVHNRVVRKQFTPTGPLVPVGELIHLLKLPSGTWVQDGNLIADGTATFQTPVGYANASVIDSGGRLHVAFISDNNGAGFGSDLIYAQRFSLGWVKSAILSGANQTGAEHLSRQVDLAVDASRLPHVVFRSTTQNSLKYATQEGTGFNVDTVVSNFGTGLGPASIALNSDGVPAIGYISKGRAHVGFAKKSGTAWSIEALRTLDGSFGWASLAFQGTMPQLTYYDTVNNDLAFFRKEPAGWNGDLIDNDAGIRGGSVVDSKGAPQVVYYDHKNKRIKHATAL